MNNMQDSALQALGHFPLEVKSVERFGTGLINATYKVVTIGDEIFVLQGLNPLFEPQVNFDIDIVTRHLESAGAVTQKLIKSKEDTLWVSVDDCNWRIYTYVPGECFDQLANVSQAEAAGALLAQFHRNVADLDIELHTQRLGVHDTQAHMQTLRTTLEKYPEHRYFADIEPLAQLVLAEAERLPTVPDLPCRLVHGDPKISNLVFAPNGQGVCMIDLDTIAHMPLHLELGDAIRSWCNPRGEDYATARFNMPLFKAAMRGYAGVAREFVAEEEWRAFVPGAKIIMVELAARFTYDALREAYFGWNPKLFPDRSTHNQVRASGQLELSRSLSLQFAEAEAAVEAAFLS